MKVFFEALECQAGHGFYEQERIEGRTFVVDLSATLKDMAAQDDLNLTLDYRELARITLLHFNGPGVHLVETLAERILTDVLQLPNVLEAEITIRKKADGVPGNPTFVGVQLKRSPHVP